MGAKSERPFLAPSLSLVVEARKEGGGFIPQLTPPPGIPSSHFLPKTIQTEVSQVHGKIRFPASASWHSGAGQDQDLVPCKPCAEAGRVSLNARPRMPFPRLGAVRLDRKMKDREGED